MIEESGKEKAKSGFNVKIIVVGLIFFLAATGASYVIMKSLLAPIMPQSVGDKKEMKAGALLSAGEFTTNVNDIGGTRFLRVEVTIETDEKKKEDVNANMAIIRDTIINTFQAKTVADLDIRNRTNLKAEITKELNARLGAEVIRDVYFTEFIMQ